MTNRAHRRRLDRTSAIGRGRSAPRRPISRIWPRSACRCRRPSCCRSSCAPPSSKAIPTPERKLADGLREGMAFLESATGRRFGDRREPLLVSVRSGAARSMPGMLDTVLDVGCTAAAVHGLVRMTGHPRFAWDCRRRFLESYGEVVLGIDQAPFARRARRGRRRSRRERAGARRRSDGAARLRLSAMIEDEDDAHSRRTASSSSRPPPTRSTAPG